MDEVTFRNRLDNTIQTIRMAEKELKEKVFEIPQDITCKLPDLADFWKELIKSVKKLSFECTKLCIAYTNLPYPTSQETIAHIQSIEVAVLFLFSVVYKFNIGLGKTLQDQIVENTIGTVDSTRQLISLIKEGGGAEISDRFSRGTGIVWEGCRYLERCPKNNKAAAALKVREQEVMVNDALAELTEAMEGDGQNLFDGLRGESSSDEEEKEAWAEQDKQKVVPTLNIIKAAKIMCKRVAQSIDRNGLCDTMRQVRELDKFVEVTATISPLVDSLVIELYPPLSVNTMELQTNSLASTLFSAIKTATQSHFITEEEQSDIEFVENAISHNLNKMKEILKDL